MSASILPNLIRFPFLIIIFILGFCRLINSIPGSRIDGGAIKGQMVLEQPKGGAHAREIQRYHHGKRKSAIPYIAYTTTATRARACGVSFGSLPVQELRH